MRLIVSLHSSLFCTVINTASQIFIQGESPDKKVRSFLKVEVAQASIILAFKIISKGRKLARVSIILNFKKVGKVERCISPTLFTEHRTSFS